MPDTETTNYKVDFAKLLEHIKQKWGVNRPCPLCGQSRWGIDETLFEVKQYQGGNIAKPYRYQPLIAVVCLNCGNTVFINLISANRTDLLPNCDGPSVVPDTKQS